MSFSRRPGVGVGRRPGFRGIGGGGAAPSPPPAWTPAAWTNDMWLRGDQTVDAGSGVATWTDLSGNGRSPTQANDALRPVPGTRAGQRALRFASSRLVAAFGSALSQPHTVYVIAELDAVSTSQVLLDGDNTTNRYRLFTDASSRWAQSSGASAAIVTAASTGIHAFALVFNGASSAMYVDDFVTAKVTGTLSGAPDGITLGSNSSGAASMTGWMWEVLYVPAAHNAANRKLFGDYAAARYSGLTVTT